MINAANEFWDAVKGRTITEKWDPGVVKINCSHVNIEIAAMEIVVFVEATKACAWEVDVAVCKGISRKIIDDCDTNGNDRKQGDRVAGDCLTWRLDIDRYL
jgi:chitinase